VRDFSQRAARARPPRFRGGGLGAGARAHVVEAGGRKAVDGNQEVSGVDQARLGRRAVGCQVLRRGIERDRAEPQRLSVQICKDVTSDRSHGRRAPFLALSSSQGSSALKWRSRRTTGTRKSRALPAWATVGRREGGGGLHRGSECTVGTRVGATVGRGGGAGRGAAGRGARLYEDLAVLLGVLVVDVRHL